ncbi:beta-carotene ketolase, partial [Fischerella thermalis CCMEE 5205]
MQSEQISQKLIDSVIGLSIATLIVIVWTASLILLFTVNISEHILVLLLAILFQTFLFTGLFITAHDAMHGVAFSQNLNINHLIGTISLFLYGFLSYKTLLKKHWMHHNHPASELDPDFHDGEHKKFFAWYFYFMKNYWSWGQIIIWIIAYN